MNEYMAKLFERIEDKEDKNNLKEYLYNYCNILLRTIFLRLHI